MQTLEELTYSETTDNITVTVHPEYLRDDSDPMNNIYVFAYTITIENFGKTTVQLLKRHWIVNSGGARYTEVVGEGVVGEQPVLRGAEGYEYMSSTIIKDPVGSMIGSYTFGSERGNSFEVSIPRFDLICPDFIH